MPKILFTDVAIIGAGTAGLYALREVKRAGKSFLIIDHGPLGTTCARVGCMPSKVALHAGAQWADRLNLPAIGVEGVEHLTIDKSKTWEFLRGKRDMFAGGATNNTLHAAGEHLITGTARFIEPTRLQVTTEEETLEVQAKAVIIANGSRPVMPGWLESVKDSVHTTDDFFELKDIPQRVGILGLGAIGLEMGLALSRLGVQVTGADLAPAVAGLADPELALVAQERFGQEMTLWLGQPTSVEASKNGVLLRSGEQQIEVDLILAALGRRPNTDQLNLAAAGLPVDEHDTPVFNPNTMQIGDLPVFMAGDSTADRPLMHEAVHEGSIAGYNAARGVLKAFERKTTLGIAFSDPDVVAVGQQFNQLEQGSFITGKGTGQSNGRAKILHGIDSTLHVYADATSGQLLGGTMVGTGGEHIAHLLAWAVQKGETARSLLTYPFYHPALEEMLQSALQDIVRQQGKGSDIPLGLVPVE